jgi:hypothetical protein
MIAAEHVRSSARTVLRTQTRYHARPHGEVHCARGHLTSSKAQVVDRYRRPGRRAPTFKMELPGIEAAAEMLLTCVNAKFGCAKRRQKT